MSLNTITEQSGFATHGEPSLFVKLESYEDGSFGFSWRKFPFFWTLRSEKRSRDKAEIEKEIQLFSEKELESAPYLRIIHESL